MGRVWQGAFHKPQCWLEGNALLKDSVNSLVSPTGRRPLRRIVRILPRYLTFAQSPSTETSLPVLVLILMLSRVAVKRYEGTRQGRH